MKENLNILDLIKKKREEFLSDPKNQNRILVLRLDVRGLHLLLQLIEVKSDYYKQVLQLLAGEIRRGFIHWVGIEKINRQEEICQIEESEYATSDNQEK